MSFSRPDFLWLLLLIILPLLLYLLALPRKRVITGALFLWEKFLSTEPFGKASERFRKLLSFSLVAAVILLLTLAAAELCVGTSSVKAKSLVIFMDVSASMNAESRGMSSLARAKAAALKVVESLDAGSEVAVVEAAEEFRVIYPFGAPGQETQRKITGLTGYDGAADIKVQLEKAYSFWGKKEGTEIYVFTDRELPKTSWQDRLTLWLAPATGDNIGIIKLSANRKNEEIVVKFTLANYTGKPVVFKGKVFVNGKSQTSFNGLKAEPGQTAEGSAQVKETGRAAININLFTENTGNALFEDDEARVIVPSLEATRVNVVWPKIKTHNSFIVSVLSALKEEGVCYPVAVEKAEGKETTIFVDSMPGEFPEKGALLICPYLSGAVEVLGLLDRTVTIDAQARDPLLKDIDLDGLTVKGAVLAKMPEGAKPLIWAEGYPLVWAGEVNKRKVFFIGIPLTLMNSRLPLTVAFPALMRNALAWLLPAPEILRPGEYVDGWTSKNIGFIENPANKNLHAFSLLNAGESDLRRKNPEEAVIRPGKKSLALYCVVLALLLLACEWVLFHKRLTE
ncbi:MAG: VWA domain-containing protein [Candidatus Firestonebacteria bacterium]